MNRTPGLSRTLFTVLSTLVLLASTSAAQAQPVYKWVDAQGKTHYGNQPPAAESPASAMKLQSSSFGGNNNEPDKYNADGTKKIPKDVEEMRDGMAKALGKVDAKTVPLSCGTAVSNITDQVDTMLETGQRNVKGGYVNGGQYEATAAKLREAKSSVSVGDCNSATGNKRAFYQCMSSNNNHLVGCAQKHPY